MMEIHGFCDPQFQPLKDAFAQNFADGLEVGASVAAALHGKPVVDLWAGHADWKRTRPWERDTIVIVFSMTKVPLVLCMLKLIEDGRVQLDVPVAAYWPEFAAGGKDHVTVREALTYQAGVPGFRPSIPFEAMRDWDAMTTNIASQDHWFGGEARFCYHPQTYGFLLGEIIRRVDGRRPSQFWRESFAEPAGIDFQAPLCSEAERARMARIGYLTAPPPDYLADELGVYTSVGEGDWMPWEQNRAEVPAANGFANGRAIARMGAIFACGGELDGIRYLSKAIVDEAAAEQVYGEDPMFGGVSAGLGLWRPSPTFPVLTPSSLLFGGYGGSLAVMDQTTGLSFGYAMNNLFAPEPDDVRQARFYKTLGAIMAGL
jgi:CubicO group peptidase (beta-lactamase class C family)